jgi:SAM-dependent methyltransferase|uniref:class I SAM-dependent methyltransferase n=1 Tax=Orrella sp. TaxID=1921583 RepID=UPI004047703E
MSMLSDPIVELHQWFGSDAGRYVQDWERQRIDSLLSDVFGYRAVQYGLAPFNALSANRMSFKGYAGPQKLTVEQSAGFSASVVCLPEQLPFDTDSIDLLVLPHTLEIAQDPHLVLREAQRVLMPEGRLVIAGFNPWSLWGARSRLPWVQPWFSADCQPDVSPARLKDWLKLLSFEIDRGHFGCYSPPFRTAQWLDRFAFMESAGDRWWPIFGATYVVSAVKRVAGMRLITPVWKRKSRRRSARQAATVVTQVSTFNILVP